MAKARRVFLSHTSELREFPVAGSFVAAAESAVARAGHAVTDMAYFTARDASPAHYCQDKMRDADVYVGLIGLRYGSPVRNNPAVSYTELEFDTATELKLERLLFLLDENATLPIPPARLRDRDPVSGLRQQHFRARLLDSGITVAMVASPEEVGVKLLQALYERGSPHVSPTTGVAGPRVGSAIQTGSIISAHDQAVIAGNKFEIEIHNY